MCEDTETFYVTNALMLTHEADSVDDLLKESRFKED